MKNMLTKEEKNRIRLEEVLRHDIRHQLEQKKDDKSRWSHIWTFVNSAFFLWFLSSIVVGTISYKYSKWEKQKEDDKRAYEQLQSLNRERELAKRKMNFTAASCGVSEEVELFLM